MLDQRSDRFPELLDAQVTLAEYSVWLSQAKLIDAILCDFGHECLATDIEVVHNGEVPKIAHVCDQCKYEYEMSLNQLTN